MDSCKNQKIQKSPAYDSLCEGEGSAPLQTQRNCLFAARKGVKPVEANLHLYQCHCLLRELLG